MTAGYSRDPQDDDAVAIVQEQLALWLGGGITAPEAWHALTGRHQAVGWAEVRAWMIGWWLRERAEPADVVPLFAT